MSNIHEDEYRNVDEYRCELRSGQEKARNLLKQLANVSKEWKEAYDRMVDFQKNEERNLKKCQAKKAEYSKQIEKIQRCRHWYFYLFWWFLYMICAACSTNVGALVLGSIVDSKNILYLVILLIVFLCIYIPFRRWSLRIAEPEGNYENVDGVGPFLFMVCVPVLSLICGYLFLIPIRGLKRGLYCKERELSIEWEKYHNEETDYKYQITEDKLEMLANEKSAQRYTILDELGKMYCCENCKHATEGELNKTYTCRYQPGLFIGCQNCDVKK